MKTEADSQLYRTVLGSHFDELPPQVRALHTFSRSSTWRGEADVERGTSVIARLGALIARLPPTGTRQPLTVTFATERGGELWHRSFNGWIFASHQCADGLNIRERIGPIRLTLTPSVGSGSLCLQLGRLHVLGIPMPWFLMPIVETREFEKSGQYRFDVEARLPVFGRLIRYSGWLEPIPNPHSSAPTSPATRSLPPHTSGQ